ncbi:hypothetical protein ScPMuIL_017771 [Solemya velum]
MSETREPPPFFEDDKDDDDLFADASNEKPEVDRNENEKPEADVEQTITNEEDTVEDDLFAGGGTEVNLDDSEEETVPEPESVTIGSTSGPSVDKKKVLAPTFSDPVQTEEDTPKLTVSQSETMTTTTKAATKETKDEPEEEDPYTIEIGVTEPQKMGDGMGAYMAYRVITRTTIPAFHKPELSVLRRFSDFLGLHGKLAERHVARGRIVPPAPEKSVIGMTKIKMSKEEAGSNDFVERRRAALERYLRRTASHPVLRLDPDFREFLEEGELPKATSTSALSGAGVLRLFHKVGDAVEKITFKMDESDEWFEEKQLQVENLDQQLRKLHSSFEALVQHRRELSLTTANFAKSAAMLGNAEEHTALSRALSQLAETEEKIELLHHAQADDDFFVMTELIKDYISLIAAVKDVFHERVKGYKIWKEAEATLTKKRETKAKLELAHRNEKLPQIQQEITEWEQKVEKGQEDFESISQTIRKEVARFDKYRVEDFKASVVKYLESLMENQQKLIKYWEAFLPEAKAIA